MNLLEYLDRRSERRHRHAVATAATAPNEGRRAFRYAVGIVALTGGIVGMVLLYFYKVPDGNREALLLALGVVLGWGGTVVNGEWGSSPAGRAAANVGVRLAEQPLDAPAGTEEDPTHSVVVNEPGEPVPTTPGKRKP